VLTLLAWLPLLVLSALEGLAVGGVRIPFLKDLDAQVRLLVALPLLLVAEKIVHERIGPAVGLFVGEEIVRPAEGSKRRGAMEIVRLEARMRVVTKNRLRPWGARGLVFAVILLVVSTAAAQSPLPAANPESVGLSSRRLQRITDTFHAEVDQGRIPWAVIAIARRGKVVYFESFGFQDKKAGNPAS
jgi:hypothetical protein